jgi:adenosine deaminase
MSAGWSKFPVCTRSTRPTVLLKILKILFKVSFRSNFMKLYWIWPGADVFQPLFEATKDPSSHPELHVFLQRIVGFDSVDDESTAERQMHHTPPPPYARLWVAKENPPYSYWYTFLSNITAKWLTISVHPPRIYYMYANMASLNNWRRARGFSQSHLHYVL